MTPDVFLTEVIDPALTVVQEAINLKPSNEQRLQILVTCKQESNLTARFQVGGGPALGRGQIEKNTVDLYLFNSTDQQFRTKVRAVCYALGLPMTVEGICMALPYYDIAGAALTRMLYLPYPKAFPALGDQMGAYNQYDAVYRPGAKRPSDWPGNYQPCLAAVRAHLI